jgi:2-dehydro-3-deoxyphosphogluconate aldolase/(4S)-4-hydroxy-2-oxoglutarate aldolase
LFPASEIGGASFVKAVKGPMPWTNIMPTGGVDTSEANLKSWFDAGVTCVGMGSNLFPKDIMTSKNYGSLADKVKELVETVGKVRGK